ncbi:Scm-like with four mbt domains [Desmophyllum pertusum]|uniref:Scm-like with four mbt domains n=1 Tax=Desmophyllum pertusum TaxID=174260 RepID=A0A9X0CYT1_9CNID|nr:Scm-like with four mbt domains [Desmophyllum pertusum]
MKNGGSGSEEEDEELFSWEEYLKKCHAKAVPKETFKHVQDTKVQGFVPGMKLECMDRTSLETDTYWVATVVMASGPLLLLRYDGYEDDRSGDFWCDAASEELQHVGWCARNNNILIPPAAIRHKEPNWAKFLKQDLKGAVCAPAHLFHRRSDPDEENQLKPGLKLELLHKDDPLSYWVASVVDAWDGERETKLRLNIPLDLKAKYPTKDWAQVRGRLLGICNLTAEDVSLNKAVKKSDGLPRPHGFTTEVKLEAVNPNDPSSICAATVSKVVSEFFFQVEIDSMISCGDGSRPSMWCSSNSRNIFPVGWCEKNNIQLTPPPGYLVHPFQWQTYLQWTNSSAASESLFHLEVPFHEFDISMKLEAVDQTDPSTMTVATVTQVVGRTMWVLLDGYKHDSVEHIYDVESFDLYPVGWCSMNGHPLLTPRIQPRPPEENRRLASLRATRQRENKKTASDTSTANTPNNTNTFTARINNISTANATNTTANSVNTTPVSNAHSAINTQVTNHSDNPSIYTEDTKQASAKMEPNSFKEEKNEVPEKNAPSTPKGKYDLRASTLVPRDYGTQLDPAEDEENGGKKKVEAVIDLTEDDDEVKGNKQGLKTPFSTDDSGICIYVKKSCDPGPFLKQAKLIGIPSIIGPAGANIVLRQLVEQIVLSAHSSKEVLKLLASETDKMSIASLLKTLTTKLSLCENLISLKKVALCSQCDRKVPLSPRKNNESDNEPATTPVKAPAALENNTPVPLKKVVPKEDSQPAGQPADRPARSVSHVNNKPKGLPVKAPKAAPVEKSTPFESPKPEPAGKPKPEPAGKPKPEPAGKPEPAKPEPAVSPSISASRASKHITQWNVSEVVDFVKTTDCYKFADDFLRQEIDGRALTLLSLDEIHKCLGVTLGPAIKLHFSVQKLRKKHR